MLGLVAGDDAQNCVAVEYSLLPVMQIKQASTLTSHWAELVSTAYRQVDRKYRNLEHGEYGLQKWGLLSM
jgi:hypothetical protein